MVSLFPPSPTRTADTLRPARAEFAQRATPGDLFPVTQTLLADLETPVSVYLKLAALGEVSFMLESVEGGEQVGRYSFIGVNPRATVQVHGGQVRHTEGGHAAERPLAAGEDALRVIQHALGAPRLVDVPGLPRFVGGAVGYIAYDVVRAFERLPSTATPALDVPDALFMLPDDLVIFDHAKHQLTVLALARVGDDALAAYDQAAARVERLVGALAAPLTLPTPPAAPLHSEADGALQANMTQADYEDAVRRAKEYIAAGDAFQIVLSQRFQRRTQAAPFAIYRALRALNPSPYMFFLNFGDGLVLMGASPEMMVRLEDGVATTHPIAGTRKRGATEAEDRALEADLLADPKERAEHVMLVDLGRNDLGRVCDYGTVHVPQMMTIERFSHVMHIVSRVQGRLRHGLTAFDLLRATFPAGTLSGAPKVRAMEIIEELEGTRRHTYGGAVGYFSVDGSMDTCITIRALLMHHDTITLQAGAGIVADSDPTAEYEETLNKARALAVAVRFAEQGLLG